LFAIVVGAALVLSSCLQVKTTINVNKDGTGTIDQTFLMKSEMIDMMSGLSSMGNSSDSESSGEKNSKEFSLYDEKQIREDAAKMGPGVTVVRSEPVTTDWGKGYHAVYAFDDISKIQVNQNPGDNLPSQMGQGEKSLSQEPDFLRFNLKKGNPAVLTVNMPQPPQNKNDGKSAEGDAKAKMSDQDIAMFTQFYADMRISVDLKFNGTIVGTNAAYRDGNSISLMDFQFGALLKNPQFVQMMKDGKSAEMNNFQNLATKFPGLKIEPKRVVEVRFR
jgi:hypothetical protein